MVHNWFDSTVQIGLVSEEDFRSDLPQYFKHDSDSKIKFDKYRVNVLAGHLSSSSLFSSSSYPQEVIINSQETLIDMKRQFLTVPSFMPYELQDKRTCCGTTNYIIYINPKHPRIREKLEKSFDLCLEKLSKGEHFAMEIRLDSTIRAYCNRTLHNFQSAVPYNPPCICITNASQKCQEFYQPRMWLLCMPVALLCGIPYCLCRGCTTIDFECQIMGDVTHVSHPTEHLHSSSTVSRKSDDFSRRSADGFSSRRELITVSKGYQHSHAHGNSAFEGNERAWHDSSLDDSAQNLYTSSTNDPYLGYKGRATKEDQSPQNDPYKGYMERMSSQDQEPSNDPYKERFQSITFKKHDS